MSGNTELTRFRPSAIEVAENALSTLRGIAGALDIDNLRAYGLAFEYAAAHEDDFRKFAEEEE